MLAGLAPDYIATLQRRIKEAAKGYNHGQIVMNSNKSSLASRLSCTLSSESGTVIFRISASA